MLVLVGFCLELASRHWNSRRTLWVRIVDDRSADRLSQCLARVAPLISDRDWNATLSEKAQSRTIHGSRGMQVSRTDGRTRRSKRMRISVFDKNSAVAWSITGNMRGAFSFCLAPRGASCSRKGRLISCAWKVGQDVKGNRLTTAGYYPRWNLWSAR